MSETKLAPIPTHVSASVDKTGRERPAHIAVRHTKVAADEEGAAAEAATSPLDGFIAKHGGAAHLRETLEAMEGHERAKLLDAMAHVEGCDATAVMKKLGIHSVAADKAFLERLDAARSEGVITEEEHATLTEVLERAGVQAALEAAARLRAPDVAVVDEPPPAVPTEAPEAAIHAEAGSSGLRASLVAQADELYQRHVDAANRAHRAQFDIEKRQIRGWKIPAQIAEAPPRYSAEAEDYLKQWTEFCQANGLTGALS